MDETEREELKKAYTVVGNVLPDKFQVVRIPRGKY